MRLNWGWVYSEINIGIQRKKTEYLKRRMEVLGGYFEIIFYL